jgi:branched-chain amino acid aminotransferase
MKRVWVNKGLVQGTVGLSVDDRGLTLGDGVFETIAVKAGVALWRFEHLERMRAAAAALGLAFPETDIENAVDALTHRVKAAHVLRLTLTRGVGGRGLAAPAGKPTLIGTVQPFDESLRFKPVTLATSSVRRNLHSPTSQLKTTSYMEQVLAAREAQAAGAEDAVMLNTAGRVACTSIGNIFMLSGTVLATPSLSEGILPGVMRAAVMALAGHAGLSVTEKRVKPGDLVEADVIFTTNSLRFLRPVAHLDGKRFATRSKLVDLLVQGLLNAEQEQIILN